MSPELENNPDPVEEALLNFKEILKSGPYDGFQLDACWARLQTLLINSDRDLVKTFQVLKDSANSAAELAAANSDQLRALGLTAQMSEYDRFYQKAQTLVAGQSSLATPPVDQLNLSQGKGQKTDKSATPSK